jgi:hypothetical protein
MVEGGRPQGEGGVGMAGADAWMRGCEGARMRGCEDASKCKSDGRRQAAGGKNVAERAEGRG